jgi:phosphonate transport system permease protein
MLSPFKNRNLTEGQRLTKISFLILVAGIIASLFSDLAIYATEPFAQIQIMLQGFIQIPSLTSTEIGGLQVLKDIGYTLSFALLGVTCSVAIGFFLSFFYQVRVVGFICAIFRAIHELFWALIFIQIFGLSATTAIVAITIPYACTFARVFNDIYNHADLKPSDILTNSKNQFSEFVYITLPQVLPSMRDYIRYRFECGIRTSAVLGFVGLPTIGFHLETAFKQAQYSLAAALLLVFFVLIGTIKYWLKDYLIPVFILLAYWFLPTTEFINSSENISRFFTQDIWPASIISDGQSWWQIFYNYLGWAFSLFKQQAFHGIVNTSLLTIMAVALTGLLVFLWLPVLAKLRTQPLLNSINHICLLLMRSTPEYILAFVLLLMFGPSMLPAVIALAIHNSGLISFLMHKRLNTTATDNPTITLSHYYYHFMPKLHPGLLALLMYRAEIILRESAILGILGVATLGFYIDSAFEDLRFDRAFLLLMITALMNVLLEQLARKIQTSITQQDVLVKSRR